MPTSVGWFFDVFPGIWKNQNHDSGYWNKFWITEPLVLGIWKKKIWIKEPLVLGIWKKKNRNQRTTGSNYFKKSHRVSWKNRRFSRQLFHCFKSFLEGPGLCFLKPENCGYQPHWYPASEGLVPFLITIQHWCQPVFFGGLFFK